MTTTIKQINTLITKVFGDNEAWIKGDIQNQLKKILGDKKKKDPNAPKRSKTAYLFYCDDHRDSVREQLGENATFPEVIKQVAAKWNKLKTDAAKNKNGKQAAELKKYYEKAEDDKARYLDEQKKYIPPECVGTPRKKTVKGKNTSPSGYMLFCKHYRETHPEICTFKEIGQAWTNLEEDKKKKFNKEALELKQAKVINTTEDDSSETTAKSEEVKDEKPKKVTKQKAKK